MVLLVGSSATQVSMGGKIGSYKLLLISVGSTVYVRMGMEEEILFSLTLRPVYTE